MNESYPTTDSRNTDSKQNKSPCGISYSTAENQRQGRKLLKWPEEMCITFQDTTIRLASQQ